MLFAFLLALGIAVAGLTAYAMSWPLVTTQLRDRHPRLLGVLAGGPFAPRSFHWLLRCKFRGLGDYGLNFLALPACIGAWAIALGGVAALLLGALVVSAGRT